MNHLMALFSLLCMTASLFSQDDQKLLLPYKANRFNVMTYINNPVNHGEAHVCLWEDDKEAVHTFTVDGVWSGDHTFWMAAMDSVGFPVTFFVITHLVGTGSYSTWDSVRALYRKGHAVQSHSAYHNPTDRHETGELNLYIEYKESKDSLESAMPYNPCYTIAYPGGGWPNDPDSAALLGYNGGRGVVAKPNYPYGINYIELQSTSVWSEDHINSTLDETTTVWNRNYRYGWSCFLMHALNGNNATVMSQLRYLKAREDRLWLAKYSDVTRYGQERDTHTLTVTEVTDSLIRFALTDSMHDTVFTYPLTVKVRVNNDWDTVTATQGGTTIPAELKTIEDNRYVLLKAVPDQGEVILTRDALPATGVMDIRKPVSQQIHVRPAIYFNCRGQRVREDAMAPGMYFKYDGRGPTKIIVVDMQR